MQFSQHWLHTWVNPQLSAEQLAHTLTMAGLEVEATELAAPSFTGVVVAEVKSVNKHPDADRLNITQVDAGTGELIQIVCGAPNVQVGIKVPCALAGAVLPGNFKIKPTKMRGQVSNGMLCSAKELGLIDEVNGLLILPEDAPIGKSIRDFLDLDDSLFTLKITPNRADCLSIKGIAREVGALTQTNLSTPEIPTIAAETDAIKPVKLQAPEDCGRFLSRVVENINPQATTPAWLKQRLERSGLRSISPLVDIGNYVMLELGQPLHMFDADKITGELIVRRAKDGESLACLNEKTVTLASNTLVVADEEKVLSIAGLMGGSNSAVDENTRNVIIESAWFTPEIIAGKSRQYGFGSDSSFRFERGVDFNLQHQAIERATALIKEICNGNIGHINEVTGNLPSTVQVKVRTARVEKVLGVAISANKIHIILQHLGLQPQACYDGFIITAPSFRFDIQIEADLIEEIGRVYGYENIPDDRTNGKLSMVALPETKKPLFSIYHQLANHGYQEVVSYAFVEEAWEHDLAANQHPIRLQNPIASQLSVMRSTLFGGLIEILHNNLNRKQNRVRIFEVARVFNQHNRQYSQTNKIAGLAYGSAVPEQWAQASRNVDFYDVKNDVTSLLSAHQLIFRAAQHPALHPGRTAEIILNEQVIGVLGELHPRWTQKYDLPQSPILFELDLIAALGQNKICYKPVSKFQPVRRDLAFIVPEQTSAQQLLETLATVSDPSIEQIALFDVYRGPGVAEGKKSLAVKIILQSFEQTLKDEEVEEIIIKIIDIARKIGAQLRS
ncbi:MAG: phenylalanine--tRNA ligase subunit beta [Snodgrassella sp.]|nr:phenylalanine--tRNA ligase subunit beta [Snodgrassella sp.]